MSLVTQETANALTALGEIRAMLAQTSDLRDVMKLRDNAEAIRRLATIRSDSLGIQNEAAEIKIRAERRAGELLAEMPGPGRPSKRSHDVTISDLGIAKMQSSRWQSIASVPPETFERHIEETKAANKELTTTGILKLAKQTKAKETTVIDVTSPAGVVNDLAVLVDEGKRFGCIYADPPWAYGNQATRAATDNHYQTMTVEQIAKLPVGSLAAEDSHLHLWTTNGFIREAFDIIDKWGFSYRSLFVWRKPQMGLGNYWRVETEYMLLGVRGSCPFLVHDRGNFLEHPRGKHSAKPGVVREMIMAVSPPPYLELFGRQAVSEWTVFGNQVDDEPRLFE